MYIIEIRYQRWAREGITWTDWFQSPIGPKFESEDCTMQYIKTLPKVINKQKREYRIINID